ncbi:hypothetical protein QLQ12_26525 [Actinoplanes sp. NEAU-A12]|uniref:DUF2157 domain-containing protein n=1 Tax=Actinoplanes sandaracinus TaxID=3045177 RepID=A0ABT6WR10_9ACTN|nr:hypothetical protein [Actinoplanes sandaracinus]MDI6102177.1 hypothetical protein [Actinoplanes sandaracinus]
MAQPGDDPLTAALDRLVERGTIDRAQADAVMAEVAPAPPVAPPAAPRRVLAEIAGYLGGSFVLGATLLCLGRQWAEMSAGQRFLVFVVGASILFGAGLAARGRIPDDVRRRLSSTLLTGAAVAAGSAALQAVKPVGGDDPATLAGTAVWLTVAAGSYLLVRSALGQLAVAVAALACYGSLLQLTEADETVPFAFGTMALAGIWALLIAVRAFTERRLALGVAATYGVLGPQILVLDDEGMVYVGHLLTAVVAVLCFVAYARGREWATLAGGVVAATLAVPEFLFEVTGGALGSSGALLIAGVTLLAGSLAGLRLRRPDL